MNRVLSTVDHRRLHDLNAKEICTHRSQVVYWMEASQRTRDNHALLYAIEAANTLDRLLTVCVLIEHQPEASARHLRFMFDGIEDVGKHLHELGIHFCVKLDSLPDGVIPLLADAALVVTDVGYLRHQRSWRRSVADQIQCRFVAVETNVVVPVAIASEKEEYAARTIRRKIEDKVDGFLVGGTLPILRRRSESSDYSMPDSLDLSRLDSPGPVPNVRGGQQEADRICRGFIDDRLTRYDADRNVPTIDSTTNLSPYLHFGQISPVTVMRLIGDAVDEQDPNYRALLDELVIRRELARNFVFYNNQYDAYQSLPDWARVTLDKHRHDKRDYLYSFEEFESAATHDRYWNAAMTEMRETGRMQGYMRMYWGKKVLEWTADPEQAFEILAILNNRYFLDGRGPNGWANVAWIFGKHDRPWKEREVYGTVRYMNANGLRRKFDIETYATLFGQGDSGLFGDVSTASA